MTDQTNDPQDLEKDAKHLGQRLAWLMAASSLPDDVKEAYMTLLPDMPPELVDKLMQMLEKNVADAAQVETQEFVETLDRIKDTYAQKHQETQKQALSEMEEIKRILKQAEEE